MFEGLSRHGWTAGGSWPLHPTAAAAVWHLAGVLGPYGPVIVHYWNDDVIAGTATEPSGQIWLWMIQTATPDW